MMMRAQMVLLVVDTQKLITTLDLYNFNAFEDAVKTLIAAARENNVEVVYVRKHGNMRKENNHAVIPVRKNFSQMEREFGKIRKGEEETYAMLLLPMEGNVLKIHREFPESNSRRLREAIGLALFDVKETYSGEKYDAGNFRNAENERLEKALLMAFDPYTNNEIMELLKISSRWIYCRRNRRKNTINFR